MRNQDTEIKTYVADTGKVIAQTVSTCAHILNFAAGQAMEDAAGNVGRKASIAFGHQQDKPANFIMRMDHIGVSQIPFELIGRNIDKLETRLFAKWRVGKNNSSRLIKFYPVEIADETIGLFTEIAKTYGLEKECKDAFRYALSPDETRVQFSVDGDFFNKLIKFEQTMVATHGGPGH